MFKMLSLTAGLSATLFCTLFCNDAAASSLRLNDSVNVDGATLEDAALVAFRDGDSCFSWKYFPSSLPTSSNFFSSASLSMTGPKNNLKESYLTYFQLMTKPTATAATVARLKEAIFHKISEPGHQCKTGIESVSQIHVSMGLIQGQTSTITGSEGSEIYSGISIANASTGRNNVHINPFNPLSIIYRVDATHPDSADYISSIVDSSQNEPVRIGEIRYYLDGILSKLESRLKFSADFSAKFETTLLEKGCQVSEEDFKGYKVGVPFVGISKAIRTCASELATQLLGSAAAYKLIFDHGDSILSVDGKPIYYRECTDEDTCREVPLSHFVENLLLTNFLRMNFQVARMEEATHTVYLGRKGDVLSSFKVDIAYLRSFHGSFGITANVYLYKPHSPSVNLKWVDSAFTKCAQKNYRAQLNLHPDRNGLYAIPVAEACRHLDLSSTGAR